MQPAALTLFILFAALAQALAAGRALIRLNLERRAHVIYGIRVEHHPDMTASLIEDEGPVLYGIYTSNVSRYQPMLNAQFSTWAKDVPRPDIVVSGSRKDDKIEGITGIPLDCGDGPSQQPCKEGPLLFRAHERLRNRAADWFVSATEDKYIWTEEVERALARLDANKPAVFAYMGCGKGHESPEVVGCKEVYANGGMCGGYTYIMSKGALNALVRQGQTYKDFMEEYLANTGKAHASDLVTSCLLYKRRIPMAKMDGITTRTSQLDVVSGTSESDMASSARKQIGRDTFAVHMVMGGNVDMITKTMHGFYNERK